MIPLITENPIAGIIYNISDPYYKQKVYQKYTAKNMKPIYIQKVLVERLTNFNQAIKGIKEIISEEGK